MAYKRIANIGGNETPERRPRKVTKRERRAKIQSRVSGRQAVAA
jgi:hypothetical protein